MLVEHLSTFGTLHRPSYCARPGSAPALVRKSVAVRYILPTYRLSSPLFLPRALAAASLPGNEHTALSTPDPRRDERTRPHVQTHALAHAHTFCLGSFISTSTPIAVLRPNQRSAQGDTLTDPTSKPNPHRAFPFPCFSLSCVRRLPVRASLLPLVALGAKSLVSINQTHHHQPPPNRTRSPTHLRHLHRTKKTRLAFANHRLRSGPLPRHGRRLSLPADQHHRRPAP